MIRHTNAPAQRGSALVLVLIFAIATLILVSTLLGLATTGLRDERERRDLKALQSVMRTGIADAVFEINKDRLSGPFDPAGDGAGANTIGADGVSGIRVFSPSGVLLGRYRTTIRPGDGGHLILTAVAVAPTFDAPRRTVAARATIDAGSPPFLNDRSALSIIGPSRDLDINLGGGADLTITDPSLTVTAVNITDSLIRDSFVAATARATIIGMDPENPGSPASGATAVSNDPAGIVDTDSVAFILSQIQEFVAATLPGATPLADAAEDAGASVTRSGDGVAITDTGSESTLTLPTGIYVAAELAITTGVTIQGSGLLIVTDEVELKNGAKLGWTGEILITGSDQAKLEVEGGGRLVVEGLLAVVSSEDQEATFEAESGSRIDVDGALLSLGSGAEGESELELDSGSELNVDGILLVLGDEAEFQSNPSGVLTVDGSMVVAAPVDSSSGGIDLSFGNGSTTTLTYDAPSFTLGLNTLRAFFDETGASDRFPVRVSAYWEGSSVNLLTQQTSDVDAHALDPSFSIGMP